VTAKRRLPLNADLSGLAARLGFVQRRPGSAGLFVANPSSGNKYETLGGSQSTQSELGTDPDRQQASNTVDASLLRLQLGRYHRSRYGSAEQRIAGMGVGNDLRPAGALQQLQQLVQRNLADPKLKGLWSSGRGEVRAASDVHGGPGIFLLLTAICHGVTVYTIWRRQTWRLAS
jgi:hypothetical protein